MNIWFHCSRHFSLFLGIICGSIMGFKVEDHLLLCVICGEIRACGKPVTLRSRRPGFHCKPVLLHLLGPYEGLVSWPWTRSSFLACTVCTWFHEELINLRDTYLFWPFQIVACKRIVVSKRPYNEFFSRWLNLGKDARISSLAGPSKCIFMNCYIFGSSLICVDICFFYKLIIVFI